MRTVFSIRCFALETLRVMLICAALTGVAQFSFGWHLGALMFSFTWGLLLASIVITITTVLLLFGQRLITREYTQARHAAQRRRNTESEETTPWAEMAGSSA